MFFLFFFSMIGTGRANGASADPGCSANRSPRSTPSCCLAIWMRGRGFCSTPRASVLITSFYPDLGGRERYSLRVYRGQSGVWLCARHSRAGPKLTRYIALRKGRRRSVRARPGRPRQIKDRSSIVYVLQVSRESVGICAPVSVQTPRLVRTRV